MFSVRHSHHYLSQSYVQLEKDPYQLICTLFFLCLNKMLQTVYTFRYYISAMLHCTLYMYQKLSSVSIKAARNQTALFIIVWPKDLRICIVTLIFHNFQNLCMKIQGPWPTLQMHKLWSQFVHSEWVQSRLFTKCCLNSSHKLDVWPFHSLMLLYIFRGSTMTIHSSR